MMRLSPDKLKEITGRELPSAQARWFKRHFGIAVICDRQGPILTPSAFDALVMSKLGLANIQQQPERPQVRLIAAR